MFEICINLALYVFFLVLAAHVFFACDFGPAFIIQSFCKRKQWTEALNTLDRMRTFGCLVNRVTVFTLIESLCTEGRVEEAYMLIDKFMVEHGVSRGYRYSALVISLIRIKKLEKAEKLFREMLAVEVKPDTFASSLLLKELCAKDRLLDGFYLLDAIKDMGCLASIDSDIYSFLLFGLCQKNHLAEATKLAKIILKKGVNSAKASVQGCERGRKPADWYT